ncbi:hypothetical protein TeGR_g11530, partial [Tetraparma gracilis]
MSTHHSGAAVAACGTCGRGCASKQSLTTHMFVHHNGTAPVTCATCEVGFGSSAVLQRHMFVHHNGTAPVTCATCEVGFGYRGELKRHMFAHTPSMSDGATTQLFACPKFTAAQEAVFTSLTRNLLLPLAALPSKLVSLLDSILKEWPDLVSSEAETADGSRARVSIMRAHRKKAVGGIVHAVRTFDGTDRAALECFSVNTSNPYYEPVVGAVEGQGGGGEVSVVWGGTAASDEDIAAGLYSFLFAQIEERSILSFDAGVNAATHFEFVNATTRLREPPVAALTKALADIFRDYTDTEIAKRELQSERASSEILEQFRIKHSGCKVRPEDVRLALHDVRRTSDGALFLIAGRCVAASQVKKGGNGVPFGPRLVHVGETRHWVWCAAPEGVVSHMVFQEKAEGADEGRFLSMSRESKRLANGTREHTGRLRVRHVAPDGQATSYSIGAFLTRTHSHGYTHWCTSDHRRLKGENTVRLLVNCAKMLNIR